MYSNGALRERMVRVRPPRFTEREEQVAQSIARGNQNKEIAYELGISIPTVKNHTANIFRLLNVYDRTSVAVYMITGCLPARAVLTELVEEKKQGHV